VKPVERINDTVVSERDSFSLL